MEEVLHSHAGTELQLSPACKLCQKYIRGPLSFISRFRGIRPHPLNPPYCNRCGDPREWPSGEMYISVLFGDIRDYTKLSERLRPAELHQMLNRYFSATTRILIQEGAVINKFIGDAMMAFFNTPYPQPDHEERALRSALRMQSAMNKMNIPSLKMGIGIHSGVALVGNIGGAESSDFTAIGDSVNIASRLQSQALGGEIVVSRQAFEKAKSLVPSHYRIEQKSLQLKGKEQAVDAFIVSTTP